MRGFFGIGVESGDKSGNLGNLMRTGSAPTSCSRPTAPPIIALLQSEAFRIA